MQQVLFGVDPFIKNVSSYQGLKIGLVTNNAATTTSGEPSRLALRKAGFNIIKLFSPEHGLSVQGEDGVFQSHHTDLPTQLPVVSLYSEKLAPSPEDMEDIDLIVFDIPDAGCRFYTYLWTLTHIMEACAASGKPLVILDRPNPIGGDLQKAEGPRLDELHCSSFIGRWDIPVRHSCSLGELARYFAATRNINVETEIIPVQNWNRNQEVTRAGWPFIPTSPAITDPETVLLYPGMGLLEGINVNEGRGTASPFKICGAPWIDAEKLAAVFSEKNLPGIKAATITYTPSYGLYAYEGCRGLQFSVTDPEIFQPVHSGLQLIHSVISVHPNQVEQRYYKTVANPSGAAHLDKLTGVFNSYAKIRSGEIPSTASPDWEKRIQPFLFY